MPFKSNPVKPTKEQVEAARGKRIPDVIASELGVLFVGINPSLYSAAVGHHFARPGNRFWPALHQSKLTPRLMMPHQDQQLIEYGYGITNLVARATARADELSDDELRRGATRLKRKVRQRRPNCVAFVGVTAYRTAFSQPNATMGRQVQPMVESVVWVLPNPSGLNAHYQLLEFARLFGELRQFATR